MPFLTLSDADIWFAEKELVWRSYTAAEALPTTQRVELIDKREFAAAAFDNNEETFMVYVATLVKAQTMTIHPSQAVQIALAKIADAPVIPTKYSDHISVFSSEPTAELLNTTRAGTDHNRCTRAYRATESWLPFDWKVAQLPWLCQAVQTAEPGKYILPGDDLHRQ